MIELTLGKGAFLIFIALLSLEAFFIVKGTSGYSLEAIYNKIGPAPDNRSHTVYISKCSNGTQQISQIQTKPESSKSLEEFALMVNQQKRKMVLRQYCKGKLKLGQKPDSVINHYMIYSDNARLMYCYLPKAACTTWKRMFQMFDRNMTEDQIMKVDKNQVHNLPLNRFKSIAENMRALRERTYYSFIITRHPLERLVATYRNKFVDPYGDYYQKVYGSRILRRFRKGESASFYRAGKGVRFKEFIDFIVETRSFDEHWERMVVLCQPCYYKYDYVAKMDTLIPDSQSILKESLLGHHYTFLDKASDKYKEKSADLVKKMYKDIPRETIQQLYQIYIEDFRAFGYNISDVLDS